ncbi:MAG: phospholipase D-like domain-containing protein [Bacillota bacterium]|nr:phospholipase D-like domain-containing protein [Bacillota bacterium]
MRQLNNSGDISVHAISGRHTVLLNMDAKNGKEKGLLGFAIKRRDLTEDEVVWLKGFLTFKINASSYLPGTLVSTWENPIQDFNWGDYTVKPNHKYIYTIVPVRGVPDSLIHDNGISVAISTEDDKQGEHSVFFNCGIAGSQAYVRKFGNLSPDQVGPSAFKWLSRGLEEALVEFLSQAEGKGWSLYASVYEFNYIPVLEEFKKAIDRGADVRIIFDNKEKGPGAENRKAMEIAGIDQKKFTIPRNANPSYISHNKFILLLKEGKPLQVWTGSTNITKGGIFGHSNVGHIIRNKDVAEEYYLYWRIMSGDPEAKELRPFNEKTSPLPMDDAPPEYIKPIFSPRSSLEALEWYAKKMEAAKSSIFLTAAFGINELFRSVLEEDKPYLRYVLIDRPGKGLDIIKRDQHNMISFGRILDGNSLENWFNDRWKEEKLSGLNKHVQYIHTKYMLIDPLGDDPMIITGSANFSENSTKNNDENMVVIRGDKYVMDMYLGEFMRLFDHFRFRSRIEEQRNRYIKGIGPSWYLAPDDSWTKEYFIPGHPKEKQKLLFRGY